MGPRATAVVLAAVVLAAVVLAAGAGCLYVEPINERPSAEIARDGDGEIFRGDVVAFRAVVDDPDRDAVTLAWRGQACDQPPSVTPRVCAAVETGLDPSFAFTVPRTIDGAPPTYLAVALDVTDRRGAKASPAQLLELPIANRAPVVTVQRRGRELMGQFPVGVPITVSARGDDPDDDAVALTWTLFPAATSTPGAAGWQRLGDPATGGEAYQLIPDVAGEWQVRVEGSDGVDRDQADLTIGVRPDHAPCLGALEPAAADDAVVLALEPRRFMVRTVSDDLDPLPATPPDDPYPGAATLAWSMRLPGATTFTPVPGATTAVDVDPATFAPGQVIEVRVEVADRGHQTPSAAGTCAIDAASCSVEPPATCRQRKTWHVEVR